MEDIMLLSDIVKKNSTLIIKADNKKLLTIEIHHDDNLYELAASISSIVTTYYMNYRSRIEILVRDSKETYAKYYVDDTLIPRII